METKSIKLGIWRLVRNDTPMAGEMTACIVIAATESQARQEANQEAKAEAYLWTDGSKVEATRLGTAEGDDRGVILYSVE